MVTSIRSITRPRDLTDWYQHYSITKEKVKGTEFEQPLVEAYQHYQVLNKLMQEVERIGNSPFQDLHQLKNLAQRLLNLEAENSGIPWEILHLVLQPGQERLSSRLKTQQTQASQMLDGLEDQFNRGASLLRTQFKP